ncbi:MAG: hypothetical protein KKF24_13400 [Gammaproteobacteria bacterium]|jgi:hypothetical protein|nr:hypothetical protein [Gammaproteobacteria bacterium]MBU1833677.1 hypothetical protein [Gammaproteobacteria bacterium]
MTNITPIDIDPNRLLELTAEKLAKQSNPDRLINKEEGGELFAVSPRHFLERITCRPGFPKSVERGRWRYGDVIKYMRRFNRAA